jgi:hypothetical protein
MPQSVKTRPVGRSKVCLSGEGNCEVVSRSIKADTHAVDSFDPFGRKVYR